jgi:hypothetical protein
MTMGWHADAATLERYAAGTIDGVTADSLEAHLIACDGCRGALAAGVDARELDRMWSEVVDGLDVPRAGAVERGLLAIGVREHVARLLSATPSLRLSWLAAEALALGTAAALAAASRGRAADAGLAVFLMLAALLPVAGVAVAFGPGVDPTYEVGLVAPMRSFRLVVLRAVAVLGTSTAIAGVAAVAMPDVGWTAAAWLLPSLGLTAATLALSTSFRPQIAAAAIAATWLAVAITAAFRTADRFAAFRGAAQLAFVVVLVVSCAVLVQRRRAFEGGSIA